MEGYRAQIVVDVQRFQEAVWAVERGNFRPGDALGALEQATVDGDPATNQGAVELLEQARDFLAQAYSDEEDNDSPGNMAYALLSGAIVRLGGGRP